MTSNTPTDETLREEAEHTPPPWEMFETLDGIYAIGDVGGDGRIATNIVKSNADFICRAVNSHEALVECTAMMLVVLGAIQCGRGLEDDTIALAKEMAHKALALSRGETALPPTEHLKG